MNKTEHLLTCLMEECAEIQKAAVKALRFGLDDNAPGSDSDNAEDISAEIADLFAVVEMLNDEQIIPAKTRAEIETLINKKKSKVERYMEYAKNRGTLE